MRWFFLLLLAINVVIYISYRDVDLSLDSAVLAVSDDQNRILLLSETTSAEGESVRDAASLKEGASEVAAAGVAEEVNDLGCLLLGPYKSRDELRRDATLVVGAKMLAERYERSADFWVYLGPYPSFDSAANISAELRAKRIDNFIIRGGVLQNAISLGVFTTDERAAVHAKRLLKKNYQVAVKRVPKEGERYWLSYTGRAGTELYTAAELAMEKKTDNNKSLGKKSCNLIASHRELD
ncbi:hypothetical protein [Zhongshania arctica]|uniref:SPOR domain-containing protein n=1 Tax=Zhongshania arctica TaxID=3238302 RepID=A0ABV3U0A6_9GAMM|tara:strand:- start:246 stop:959 length:714 start_codon:yes stop_codon:yes gene_type:complete